MTDLDIDLRSLPPGISLAGFDQALKAAGLRVGSLRRDLFVLCRLNPSLVSFITDGGQPTLHYVALCMAALKPGDRAALARLATDAPSVGRRELLSRLWGADLGSTRLLSRLDWAYGPLEAYRTLARLLRDPEGRARLAGIPRISRRAIHYLAQALEAGGPFLNPALLGRYGPRPLAFLCKGLARMRPDLAYEEIVKQVDSISTPDGVNRLVARLMTATTFPEPPWPGIPLIRPIRTAQELRTAGLQMNNCLNSPMMWAGALRGEVAYYWCRTDPPMIAALAYNRIFDLWYLQDLNGRKNKVPSPKPCTAVISAFEKAGFPDLIAGTLPSILLEGL